MRSGQKKWGSSEPPQTPPAYGPGENTLSAAAGCMSTVSRTAEDQLGSTSSFCFHQSNTFTVELTLSHLAGNFLRFAIVVGTGLKSESQYLKQKTAFHPV